VLRHGHIAVFHLARSVEILHLERLGQFALQRVIYISASNLLKNRPCRIEVPIVIEKPAARADRSARRRMSKVVASVGGGVIHAGTRRKQIQYRCVLLAWQ
jgi:hypothetical protein